MTTRLAAIAAFVERTDPSWRSGNPVFENGECVYRREGWRYPSWPSRRERIRFHVREHAAINVRRDRVKERAA